MFLKFQGLFYSLFQHSAISNSFTTLCMIQASMSNLCRKLSVAKISPFQEIYGQKKKLFAILWTILTFMKFCGDYYDIYENERKIH